MIEAMACPLLFFSLTELGVGTVAQTSILPASALASSSWQSAQLFEDPTSLIEHSSYLPEQLLPSSNQVSQFLVETQIFVWPVLDPTLEFLVWLRILSLGQLYNLRRELGS